MKTSLILLGLSAYTVSASTIKNRLAQGEPATPTPVTPGEPPVMPELAPCECELPGLIGEFPVLGQGQFEDFGSEAGVGAVEEIVTVPDSEFTQLCESECCACSAEVSASQAEAQKIRTFDINGSISIAESVELAEAGSAEEESVGHSQKATACITNNLNGVGAPPNGDCIEICLPDQGPPVGGGDNGASAPK